MSHKYGPDINVLSFGAGVQSTTMALMIKHGEIPPVVAGVFADTQSEPDYVYKWLEQIKDLITFPIITSTAGNLATDVVKLVTGEKNRIDTPPFNGRVSDKLSSSYSVQLTRACTGYYKLRVIRRVVKRLKARYNAHRVNQYIGISTDEAHRIKSSDVWYVKNQFPLIDLDMSRDDCIAWLSNHNYPVPKKSSCWMCPYKSYDGWKELKSVEPHTFKKACELDEMLRPMKIPRIEKDFYIWSSLKPLSMLFPAQNIDENSRDGFGNECEGLCGV